MKLFEKLDKELIPPELSTAHLADSCLRVGVAVRYAPVMPISAGLRVAGRAVPVRHYGSVDVFLEAIDSAAPGSVLVVDNAGRKDEACIGDLVTLEAQHASIRGIIIWGCHRDTEEIRAMHFPLFSLGAIAAPPMRTDPREREAFLSANVAGFTVVASDVVVADDDGALFFSADSLEAVVREATDIRDTERNQAKRVQQGSSMREQFRFAEFLRQRSVDPTLTFRAYLRSIHGSIEE
ncbi:MAG: RraA family protein [Candidatus Eremiobacteraeota bacterium]|nr:RraA family protein [Candidatus Eremiobacteraeota bacterium]